MTYTLADLDALPPAVNVPTAAHFMGVSERHARDLIKADRFPVRVLRVGSRVTVPTADLRAYLLGDTTPATGSIEARLDQIIALLTEIAHTNHSPLKESA